jgi:hypothetical protein
MNTNENGDAENKELAQQRLRKILQGAFGGPPTPLKNIPTRSGESRQLRRPTDTPTASPTQKPRRLKRKIRPSQVDDR